MHPAVAPRGQVILIRVAEPGDHHRGIAACGVRCLRVGAQTGARDGLRGVELEARIQLGEGGLHLKLEGLVIQRAHNVTALEDIVVLLPQRLQSLRAKDQHVTQFSGQLVTQGQQRGALEHVAALEGLVLNANLAAEGPVAAIFGGVHHHGTGLILALRANDHPPEAITLEHVRISVVGGVALLGAGNQRGQLTSRLGVLTGGGKNLVGLAVALGVLDVTGVEELKTAGNLNSGARVATVRVVAAIRDQSSTLIGPVGQVLTHGVTPVHHTLGVQGRVLVESMVALAVKDKAVRVVQAADRRSQVQGGVVAIFANSGTKSIQDLLCLCRQVTGGAGRGLLILFLLLAHVLSVFVRKNVWVVSSHHTAPRSPVPGQGERHHRGR